MKRLISTILTLAMLLSLFTVFAVTGVAAITEITNASPAITAIVGDTIDLSGYSVVFDGDSTATTGIVWKNAGGSVIDSLDITAKGVTKLTATSGSKTKTIYVVAKNPTDSEYVLYEANMSGIANLDSLVNAGWTLPTANGYTVSGGNFNIVSSGAYSGVTAYLPKWLGDFGDYSFSVNAKITSLIDNDSSRWLALQYRSNNLSATPTYYHMCVRANNTVNNGIEFTERITDSAAWNVMQTASGENTTLSDTMHSFTIRTFGNTIGHYIDGEQLMYITDLSKIQVKNAKGYLGITMTGGTLAVESVKVTVQENAPVKEARKLDLINIGHDELSLINPIANVERLADISVLDSADAPDIAYRNVSHIDDLSGYLKKCVDKSILPTLYVNSNDDVNRLVSAMTSSGCKDVNVLANNAAYLKSIRASKPNVRTGLIINDPSAYSTVHELRVAVRSAPATFCVIPLAKATKELVMEIQEYAVAVWVSTTAESGSAEFDEQAVRAVATGANGIITNDASAAATAINKNFAEGAMTRTPIIIGHRGNPSQAPENTLSGFIKAYENGVDVFEVDVEITKDGEIIIMHDNTINRTTTYTGTKTVNQMTLSEIKQYYILATDNDKSSATTEKVPTLKEVCDYFKDKDCKIFVEFKGSNAQNVPVTMKLLDTVGMDYLVDVISFSATFLQQTQANSAGMSTGYLLSSQTAASTWDEALTSLNVYLNSAQPINSTINPSCGVVYYNTRYFTQAATDRGMTVWPWTFNYNNNDVGFFSGCDGVTTDDAQWARSMAKYLTAKDFTLVKGQAYVGGNVVSIAYGNTETIIPVSDTICSVVSGNENVAIVDGKLVGINEGTATVIFGYATKTATGRDYIVYSEPVTVTVGEASDEMLDELVAVARRITVSDYTEESIKSIRECCEKISSLSASATAEERNALALEISDLIASPVKEIILSKDKTYVSEGIAHGTYGDSGTRLTDGSKGNFDGGKSNTYAGFSDPDGVTVTVDLGTSTDSDTYRIYAIGGDWGIQAPEKLTVRVSTDGNEFSVVGATVSAVLMNKTDTWCTYEMAVKLDTPVNARYIAFDIDPTNTFTWIDEVEVSLVKDRPAADKAVYVTAFNQKITSGQSVIFTPDFGTISVSTANHAWTANLIAKWDTALNAYVVTSVSHGVGADTASVTLASDEIMIATHKWDIYDTSENPFVGSKLNNENLVSANVGDTIVFSGIDVSTKTLSTVAPYFTFTHIHKPGTEADCVNDQICELCKEVLVTALGHTEGEWKTLDDGSKEQRCTVCGTLVGFEPAPTVKPENSKNFWVTHINNNTIEGAGVIFTESYTGAAWWLHVAFKPVTDLDGYFEIVEISDGTDLGDGTALSIPEGGFVWAANYGNDYPTIYPDDETAIDYTSENCTNAIIDASTWTVGMKLKFHGIDPLNPVVSTTTPTTNWYDDGYICTSFYSVYIPPHVHTPGTEADCVNDQTCTECGEVLVSAKGHTPGAEADCVNDQTCTVCGEILASAKGHTPGTEADCVNDQTCTVCGEVLASAKGHTAGEWVTLDDGSKEQRCSVCNELLATEPAPEQKGMLGDVNNDGAINQYDYILVKRHYFETRYLTDDEMTRADVNLDGNINQYDYILIKRHYFGTYTIG